MIRDFPRTGADWSGLRAAEAWLTALGYSFGRMQRADPIGVLKGAMWDIQKWRNLNATERKALAGTIVPTDGSFRHGGARVELKEEPLDRACKACFGLLSLHGPDEGVSLRCPRGGTVWAP